MKNPVHKTILAVVLAFIFLVPYFVSAAKYPDGTLIRADRNLRTSDCPDCPPTVYLIEDGKKRGIHGEETFNYCGFQWSKVKTVDASTVKAIPTGEMIDSYFPNSKWCHPHNISQVLPEEEKFGELGESIGLQEEDQQKIGILSVSGAFRNCPSTTDCGVVRYYADGTKVKIVGIDESGEWYQVIAKNDSGDEITGWMHYSLFTQDFRDFLLKPPKKASAKEEKTSEEAVTEKGPVTISSFLLNRSLQISLTIIVIGLLLVVVFKKEIKKLLIKGRKNLDEFFKKYRVKPKIPEWSLRSSLVAIIISLVIVAGVGYGAVEYKKTSDLIKEARQLVKEEKYSEANEKLELVTNKWFVKNLGIKRQKVVNEIEKNKKLDEDKSKYNQGLSELDKGNLQTAIDLLSELSEDSFYYQKAQTKIEEAKRKIIEGELRETEIAKEEAEEKAQQEAIKRIRAEARAKQEEFEKKLKEQQLSEKEAEERKMNADNDSDGLTYRRELELGTSDWNLDSDGDGIIDSKDSHPAGGGRNIAQTFVWDYGDYTWTWTAYIHEDWYDYYRAKPRSSVESMEYITSDDPFIKKISKRISEAAKGSNINEALLAISFVQNLPYVDDIFTGYDETPKYPIETFFEKNGDCEDMSYLTASIINAMGYGSVLILLPGHMAVGVYMDCDTPGTYYKVDGRCYYYIETTSNDFTVGEIPGRYRNTRATIIKIPSGKTVDVYPQYIKPCYASSEFSGYYTDKTDYYKDSRCRYKIYCLPFLDYYYNYKNETLYWDSGCTKEVVAGCQKSTTFPGYFWDGNNWYYDSRCSRVYNPYNF